jgi:hypothetical protein
MKSNSRTFDEPGKLSFSDFMILKRVADSRGYTLEALLNAICYGIQNAVELSRIDNPDMTLMLEADLTAFNNVLQGVFMTVSGFQIEQTIEEVKN